MASPSLAGVLPVPVISYLIDNRRELVEIAIAVHALALLVVNLTPTPRDNEAAGAAGAVIPQLYKALEVLAGIVSPMAKR
jgi:hypothetical protein